jgi:hypothetical protein
MNWPDRLDNWAFDRANKLVLLHHYLPYEAAEEAWNAYGLHGGDRQEFIDRVEAFHITPKGAA